MIHKFFLVIYLVILFSAAIHGQTSDKKSTGDDTESSQKTETDLVIIVVKILIDEKGNVIKAKAKRGDKTFRKAAENSALKSKFSPTILNGEAVQVEGNMTFKFVKKKKTS